MRVKFIKEALDGVAHAFGEAFPRDKWVKVDHLPAAHQAALAANPTFHSEGEPPSPSGEGGAKRRVGNDADER